MINPGSIRIDFAPVKNEILSHLEIIWSLEIQYQKNVSLLLAGKAE